MLIVRLPFQDDRQAFPFPNGRRVALSICASSAPFVALPGEGRADLPIEQADEVEGAGVESDEWDEPRGSGLSKADGGQLDAKSDLKELDEAFVASSPPLRRQRGRFVGLKNVTKFEGRPMVSYR